LATGTEDQNDVKIDLDPVWVLLTTSPVWILILILSLYFDFKRDNVRVCLVSPGFIKTPMTDKNDFKMPFLKTPEYAADQIYDGLINKNIFEIHFPKALTITLKLLSFLPSKIYFGLIGRLTKYQKK